MDAESIALLDRLCGTGVYCPANLADFDLALKIGAKPFAYWPRGPKGDELKTPTVSIGWAFGPADARDRVNRVLKSNGHLDHFVDDADPIEWLPPEKISKLRELTEFVIRSAKRTV